MQYNSQFWIVAACVLLAGWRMGLRVWRGMLAWGGAGSCGGGCHGCASGSDAAEPPVVQLDLPADRIAK